MVHRKSSVGGKIDETFGEILFCCNGDFGVAIGNHYHDVLSLSAANRTTGGRDTESEVGISGRQRSRVTENITIGRMQKG